MGLTSLVFFGAVAIGMLGFAHAGGTAEQAACEDVKCPPLKCAKKLRYQNETMCCPECQCRYKGKTIGPGSFCQKGRICVCKDGKIKCSFPNCPVRTLDCVDHEVGEDCCFYCPNGPTCYPAADKKTIIKYGEYKNVKSSVCTCAGDPWFPYAFCAPRKVSKSLLQKYGDFLVDYMEA